MSVARWSGSFERGLQPRFRINEEGGLTYHMVTGREAGPDDDHAVTRGADGHFARFIVVIRSMDKDQLTGAGVHDGRGWSQESHFRGLFERDIGILARLQPAFVIDR